MNTKDARAKLYLADRRRFADLFNVYFYDGEQVINPDDLQERDVTEILTLYYGIGERALNKQKWRDLLKKAVMKTVKGTCYVLLGVENQSEIHYAMPVRNMIYDAINYGSQVEEARRLHEEEKDYSNNGEFLSGFTRKDRLTPVVTLVVYWGSKKWDAPTTLHEMLKETDERVLRYIPDYKVNLLTPYDINDFTKFQTSIGEVLEIIKVSESMEKMRAVIEENKEFQHLEADAVRMINVFTNLKIKMKHNEKEVNMCKAWEDWKKYNWELGKTEGKAEGKVGACQENILELLEEVEPVPSDIKEYVELQKDMATLKQWIKFAAKAVSLEEWKAKVGNC